MARKRKAAPKVKTSKITFDDRQPYKRVHKQRPRSYSQNLSVALSLLHTAYDRFEPSVESIYNNNRTSGKSLVDIFSTAALDIARAHLRVAKHPAPMQTVLEAYVGALHRKSLRLCVVSFDVARVDFLQGLRLAEQETFKAFLRHLFGTLCKVDRNNCVNVTFADPAPALRLASKEPSRVRLRPSSPEAPPLKKPRQVPASAAASAATP
jgi:hypothetical protein